MKVLIIEDEKPAAQKLKKMLESCRYNIHVEGIVHDIGMAIHWFDNNFAPELIFMDIELTDGLSFDIFKKVNITSPVIFVTAYDEYWQNALKHNGIDYLLKPISMEKLEVAIGKYAQIKTHFISRLASLFDFIENEEPTYRSKLLIKKGKELVQVHAEEIAYILAEDKVTILYTRDARKLILDQSLSQLESELDPQYFFRANRKFIIHQSAIDKITIYSKGRIKLVLAPDMKDEVIISQENASNFKSWMEGK